MTRSVHRAMQFWDDYAHRATWYLHEAGPDIVRRLEKSVEATIDRIGREPSLGRVRRFQHPDLQNLRSICLLKPFDKLLLFYRIGDNGLEVWRLMHGARNLGRRLLEPNDYF